MSLVRLSRLILVAGLACMAAVVGGAVYHVTALDHQNDQLEALIALQRDVGALSVGADAIAHFGADDRLIEDYERDALHVRSQLTNLGRQVPDARAAISAIDLIVADLRRVAGNGGAAEMALNGSSAGPGFEAFVLLANIASHGIALDAAVSEAVYETQLHIRQRAWNVSAGLTGLAGLFLFAAVVGFALIHRAIGLPLRELAGTIRGIEAGETDRRARVVRNDEVGEVVRAFNSLIDRRQQAEARLEASEALLRMAGEIARFGGWSYDARTRQIDWSEETAAIHGEPPGQNPDHAGALEYYVPEDRTRISALMERCLGEGTPFDGTFRLITAEGRRIWVRTAGNPVRDAGGRIIGAHGAFQDVTDLLGARTEAERRNAELQSVIASIGDGFMTLAQDWTVTYINAKGLELLDRTEAGLTGRNIWDAFPEARDTSFEQHYQTVLDTGQSAVFVEFFPPLELWFEVNAHPTPDGIAIYFRDCTEDQAKQQELRLLKAAIERSKDIILITEADTGEGPDQPRIVYVNQAFEDQTGFTRAEALSGTPRMLQGPETQRTELDRVRAALEKAERVRVELINYRKSGERFWLELDISPVIDESGAVTHFVGVQRDITDRKQSGERLRISEERFRLVSEASSDVLFDIDADTGACWVSENYEKLIGPVPDEPFGLLNDLADRVPQDQRPDMDANFQTALNAAAGEWQMELPLQRDDGDRRIFVARVKSVAGREGAAQRVVGGLTDVTEARMLDSRLHESQKLEALGELTGGVAHDFNNLLTIIIGNADIMMEGEEKPSVRDRAGVIVEAAERGAALTSGLLAFARRQPLSPSPTDVNILIDGMLPLLQQAVSDGILIENSLRAKRAVVAVDPNKLETALLNLAINARQAMGERGALMIETEDAVLDAQYVAGLRDVESGHYLAIAVSDIGPGMSDEVREHAFEPYFTTRSHEGGTGLGLSSVYGFIKQSKGHARICSEEGRGTTVKLYLPVSSEVPVPHPLEDETQIPYGSGETVLVVEDDPALRQNAIAQIERLGYRTVEAADGDIALLRLEETADIALLFTDMVMPGSIGGRELAVEARRRRPGLAVLLTSGYTRDAVQKQGGLDPDTDLLSKPYRIADLARALHRALQHVSGSAARRE